MKTKNRLAALKKIPPEQHKQRVNIACHPILHRKGQERAAALGLSFSTYIESLIRDEIENDRLSIFQNVHDRRRSRAVIQFAAPPDEPEFVARCPSCGCCGAVACPYGTPRRCCPLAEVGG